MNKYEKIIEDLNNFMPPERNNTDIYFCRGIAYYNLGQYQRSIEDFDKAIQLKPNYARAYTKRGQAYEGLGQYQQAIEDFDKAIQVDPNRSPRPLVYQLRKIAYDELEQAHSAWS